MSEEIENLDYVVCQVCGRHFKMINATHLKKHNMTVLEYKQLYPQSLTICSEMRVRRGHSLAETLSDPAMRDKWADIQIERYKDPLEREKTGVAMLKHYEEHPETAIKIGKGVSKTLSDPIVRQRYIDGQNERWKDNPEERENARLYSMDWWDNITDEERKIFAISISCGKQGISIEEFDDFLYNNDRDHRGASPEYAQWRTMIFERDDYTCQECGHRGGDLNAHHLLPYRDYPDPQFSLNPKNGITLCVTCHRRTFGKEYEFWCRYFDIANGIRQL